MNHLPQSDQLWVFVGAVPRVAEWTLVRDSILDATSWLEEAFLPCH